MRLLSALLVALILTSSAVADDGAASVAVGGIVFKREPGIVMAKEALSISPTKVSVDYEFRNETDADITTEVAFPIPPYKYLEAERGPRELGFDDFSLSVEGHPVVFQTEVKGFVGGQDVTRILREYKVDIATFNHTGADPEPPDMTGLSVAQRAELLHKGILKKYGSDPTLIPAWTVVKRYHWTQVFPARTVLHVHHQYTPINGSQQVPSEYISDAGNNRHRQDVPYGMDPAAQKWLRQTVASFCLTPKARAAISRNGGMYSFAWIDFVLTTANTWKRPIEEFTLNVERLDPKDVVSFCWDGDVRQLDANHFQAHVTNFIPKRELRIGYYQPLRY